MANTPSLIGTLTEAIAAIEAVSGVGSVTRITLEHGAFGRLVAETTTPPDGVTYYMERLTVNGVQIAKSGKPVSE